MTKSVWTDCLLQSNCCSKCFDGCENRNTGKLASITIKKRVCFRSFLWWFVGLSSANIVEIYFQILHSISSDRNKTFFMSFPDHAKKACIEMNVVDSQFHKFTHTQPRT